MKNPSCHGVFLFANMTPNNSDVWVPFWTSKSDFGRFLNFKNNKKPKCEHAHVQLRWVKLDFFSIFENGGCGKSCRILPGIRKNIFVKFEERLERWKPV